MKRKKQKFLDIALKTGSVLRVEPVTPSVFRIRFRPDGKFREPGLVRYGIVLKDWPAIDFSVKKTREKIEFRTAEAVLAVSTRDGRMCFQDARGRILLRDATPPGAGKAGGFDIRFALSKNEKLYGLGDETRDRIQKRGHKNLMVLRSVASYAPIPFVMSSAGWAVFLNTTWFHQFDAGADDKGILRFWSECGEMDYYLFAGDSLPVLLDRYTQIAGRPHLLPIWAYGLTFVCDERGVRARDVLYEAHTFRQEKIPCDLIGLEPDWMEKRYDFSVDKQWSSERFHRPEWKPHNAPGGFAAALNNMGFKLSLWLCCDYDVSEYEENLVGGKEGVKGDEDSCANQGASSDDLFKDPHFIPQYFDKITKPGQPWFEHLKKFVDDGAQAFKLDGSNQICFHPDRKWKNGMPDSEMHNLYPVLLNKQMNRGYQEHTGKRAMIYSAGGYAGIQRYAATWAGDTGGGMKPLVSILNHGLSGHSNTSCDMQVWNREGIHFGFFQPWCQILSWYMYNQPWFLGDKLFPIFKFYARLRYRLLPYFYSAAHVAARTGMPMMRAMPLVAPEDPRSDELLCQYMLGDAFLTCAFARTIHLPKGKWVDYWTGETFEGPVDLPCKYPSDRGGPLFVRGGAIIPTWPDMQYVGQVPIDEIGLDVYPDGESSFTLYEDDGVTPEYLQGKLAATSISCVVERNCVRLVIQPRVGRYQGMPENRSFEVRIRNMDEPREVTVNGKRTESAWSYDGKTRTVTVRVEEDKTRRTPVLIECGEGE
ncbi:MAG: glycoside hydrolase family 31 protein [Verrucomicrobiae bacterium]|nr:glycoside hydrolase family 31 protein [Verrucomicrobiae bacterium]